MFSLIRSVYRYTDISGLFRSQLRQFHPDLFEMQASHFFIQVLRQAVYIYFVFLLNNSIWASVWFVNELLITNDGCPVAQPRLTRRPSANNNTMPIREIITVYLRLDIHI